MAKRKKKKPIPRSNRLIDFLLSVLSGVIAAAIWYIIERLLSG